MRVWLSLICIVVSLMHPPLAAAGPPGVKLVVNPPNLVFRQASTLSSGTPAVAELQVQVLAPPRQTWRLTVMSLGPIMSAEGNQLPAGQITWKGSPGAVFLDGVLSAGSPQLCGRGTGPKTGVLQFVVRPSQEAGAGNYNQKLLFSLSSP
jgi:hypothetical protein